MRHVWQTGAKTFGKRNLWRVGSATGKQAIRVKASVLTTAPSEQRGLKAKTEDETRL